MTGPVTGRLSIAASSLVKTRPVHRSRWRDMVDSASEEGHGRRQPRARYERRTCPVIGGPSS